MPDAIHTVAGGRPALPTLSRTEVDQLASRLSEDDRPVLRMLAHGVRSEEASRALRLSNQRLRAARARIVRQLTRLVHPTGTRMDYGGAPQRRWARVSRLA